MQLAPRHHCSGRRQLKIDRNAVLILFKKPSSCKLLRSRLKTPIWASRDRRANFKTASENGKRDGKEIAYKQVGEEIRDEDIWSPLQILDHSDREKIEPILEVGGIMPVI